MPKESRKRSNEYFKYAGLAFEMLAIMGAGVWLGSWLDRLVNTASSVFTLAFAIISVFLALGLVFKEVIRKK